jgi:Tol biopolymer transport system component/tRNA A-37 threonylcarbamoyl transferase component Bud32
MPVSSGTRLGPYEIVALIGAGGMGEVYRARDPRMNRDVAIKVSAERFSDRFEREVHAVAALNHPNICHIYDVGPNYLVMELIEGPTLADRIKGGAVPLEEALTIAHQIADALEAAHEKGIVHRDLKPANIKIKTDGTVKVLDFGLAKIAEQVMPAGSPESTPTLTIEATSAGHIVGTPAYMAPEQARSQTVDKRADIWAFGVVVYEMLTGRRLFEGKTISDTLVAVLKAEPEWNRVPAKARRLLQRCLEKDQKRRLRDICDAWGLLEDVPVKPLHAPRIPWVIAGVATVLAIVAVWALWRGGGRKTDHPAVRLDFDLGADVSLGTSLGPAVIVSPDSTRLVFVSEGQDGIHRLFTRRLDQTQLAQLPHTEGAYEPFFSPDGQWVAFFARGKLKKTRIDGGEPVSLCDAPNGRGASWGEDGNIVAALDPQAGLSQVSSAGGNAFPITELSTGEDSHRWPQVLPGGKFVLFTISTVSINFDEAGIAILSLKDRQRTTLLEHAGMYPRYLATGHLAYVTKGALFAAPFDLNRLEITGAATRLEEVGQDTARGFAQADFSPSGVFAFRMGGTTELSTVQWLDSAGKTESLGLEAARYNFPRTSPDGKRLAYLVIQGSSSDIWIYDWQRGIKTRLTNGLIAANPVWSPDARFIVFDGPGGIFWIRADGAGTPQALTRSKYRQMLNSFAPDSKRLVFTELISGAKGEIRILPLEIGAGEMRAGEPQSFVKTSSQLTFAAVSPDGKWLAYANAEGGPYEVYVRPLRGSGGQVQISNAGGVIPLWSKNGRELFYRTEDQRIMVANYTVTGDSFIAERPREWFGKRLTNIGMATNLDVAPDGKRLVVLMPAETPEAQESKSHVTLVVNFFDEVRRRIAGQVK